MSPTEIIAIVAMTIYAIYKQSIKHPVVGKTRFKLALIYGIVGLSVGGFYLPPSAMAWAILLVGVLLSIGVGVARGKLSRVWKEADGTVFSQGTPLTIALFLALIGAKFAIGTWQYMTHQPAEHGEHGGFGEVLILIGLMVAMQAEIIWRRGLALGVQPVPTSVAAATAP